MRNLLSPALVLMACLLITMGLGAPQQDLVRQFPEIHYNQHKWYSGYLDITGGKFHYVFFDSQRDPDNDPVMLWLNGGPGCSSMIGMVYENGPFVFEHNTTSSILNDYAWNKKANLLFIESPGGVGYSVSNRTTHSDATVAQDNLEAVLSFFKKFPNLKKNDFYISGQSYAGIYIPWLAWKILEHNELPTTRDDQVKIKGILVGNACTDPQECSSVGKNGTSKYQYQFLYKHAYYTEQDYNYFKGACMLNYTSAHCNDVRQRMDYDFAKTRTSILNIYGLCYGLPPTDGLNNDMNKTGTLKRKIKQSGRTQIVNDELDCQDTVGIMDFFNKHGNFQRLHVDGAIKFEMCSGPVLDKFIIFENASVWIYPHLMRRNLRIWVYSGDVDADVPITGTIAWLQRFREEHGLPVIDPWREWWTKGRHKHQDQVAGMTWQMKGITFASVKGAGHEVPRDKRLEAYTLVDSFLAGVPLPEKSQ